jgi:hypothetical protein
MKTWNPNNLFAGFEESIWASENDRRIETCTSTKLRASKNKEIGEKASGSNGLSTPASPAIQQQDRAYIVRPRNKFQAATRRLGGRVLGPRFALTKDSIATGQSHVFWPYSLNKRANVQNLPHASDLWSTNFLKTAREAESSVLFKVETRLCEAIKCFLTGRAEGANFRILPKEPTCEALKLYKLFVKPSTACFRNKGFEAAPWNPAKVLSHETQSKKECWKCAAIERKQSLWDLKVKTWRHSRPNTTWTHGKTGRKSRLETEPKRRRLKACCCREKTKSLRLEISTLEAQPTQPYERSR